MAYYTYEGDSLVLVNDPPDAVYVPQIRDDGGTYYYILDSAGRMVGGTNTPPPSGTRVAPASAMGENGQIDVSQIPAPAAASTLEGALQQYNQSNFDVGSTAALIRQLGQQSGLSEAELTAAVPVFGNEHRGAYNSGYTEGSNYNAIAQRAVSDALRTRGTDPSRFNQATQGFVDQGTQQAQERWQETQKDTSFGSTGLGKLASMAVQGLSAYFGGPIGAAASSYALSGGDVGKAALSAGLTYAGGQLSGTGSGAPGGSWYSPSGDISSVSNKLFSPEMVDVMGGTESAMANTAAETLFPYAATNVGGYTPPVQINPIQNTAAGITETELLPWNSEPVLPPIPPVETQLPMAPEQGWVPETLPPTIPEAPRIDGSNVINPLELPAGNPPLQPTNAAGQAIGAGAAAAAGIGATQAAGAGLTASQLLSGASTAVGAGGLLSSFMNSVGANPMMKALLTGQGIAGIVSGLTSTNGLMSPQEAQAMADPFASSRQQYITQLNALMANPALTTSTPGYQFNLQQGLAGIEAKQAKSGISRTGAGDIGVQQFGQQAAMSSFDQQVANLSKLSGASQSPSAGAQAALTAQGQKVSQRNAGMQAIGQGIGAIGQAQIPGMGGTQPGGYSMPNGWGITDPTVNTDYTQGYDPNTPSMQPMGGYVADPTTGMAPPQNLWGA